MKLECVIKGHEEVKKICGIEGQVVGIGQQRLPEENVGIPEREFSACVRVDQHLPQRIMKIENVPKVKILGRKERIGEKERPREQEQERTPQIRVVIPGALALGIWQYRIHQSKNRADLLTFVPGDAVPVFASLQRKSNASASGGGSRKN